MELDDFKRRLTEAGLAPTDTALQEMFAALPHLAAMQARVDRDYDLGDEPATIFDARPGS